MDKSVEELQAEIEEQSQQIDRLEELLMTEQEVAELYYLVGRLIGLRTRLGHDINQVIYYDHYRVVIEVLPEVNKALKEDT